MATSFSDLVRPELHKQPTYQPGKPIEYVARELGLDPHKILKLASNENPFGPSPRAFSAASAALQSSHLYPDGGGFELKTALSRRWGLEPEQFLLGNGSNEVLELLGHAFIRPGDEVIMGEAAFIVYKLVTLLFGGVPIEVPTKDGRHDLEGFRERVTQSTRLVFLASPDNPSGSRNTSDEILRLIESLPEHVTFVMDEAYAEYVEDPLDLRPQIAAGNNIFCTRTFSKIYGLAGLRIGYGYGSAELVQFLNRVREPFNANSVAQAAAVGALADTAFVDMCAARNREGLIQLNAGFEALGLAVIPSSANFVTVEVGDGDGVFGELQRDGVIVRPLSPYGMKPWIRVTVGREEENERVLQSLRSCLRR